MPNEAVEIHDSVLEVVSLLRSEAQLMFSHLYIHRSEGEPGIDAGSGWSQKGILHICDAIAEGAFHEFRLDLIGGQVQKGQQIIENSIPLPLQCQGSFELRLQAKGGEQTRVIFRGSGAEMELHSRTGIHRRAHTLTPKPLPRVSQ